MSTVPTTTAPVRAPLPGGETLGEGTPLCTPLGGGAYDCRLPSGAADPDATQVLADRDSTLSGGCRSTSVDGTSWACYLGSAAVAEGLVSADALGTFVPKGRIEG